MPAGAKLGKPQWPTGVAYHDGNFGDSIVYFDQVEVPVPITRGNADHVTLQARFQGCLEHGICYPMMTRTRRRRPAARPPAARRRRRHGRQPPAPPATGGMSQTLLGALLLALGGGLLLNLMPCVLPVLSLKAVSLVESRESSQQHPPPRPGLHRRRAGQLRRGRPGGDRPAHGRHGLGLGLPAAAAGLRRGAGLRDAGHGPELSPAWCSSAPAWPAPGSR